MDSIHEHRRDQSIPPVNDATQFALVRLDRLVYLIGHYEALKVDAETLPPAAHRPPLAYVHRSLCKLRRELRLREGAGQAA